MKMFGDLIVAPYYSPPDGESIRTWEKPAVGTAIIDDVCEIARVRRQLRKDSGLHDDNWHTAEGNDLDIVASGYDIYRGPSETDFAVRGRIEAVIKQVRKVF